MNNKYNPKIENINNQKTHKLFVSQTIQDGVYMSSYKRMEILKENSSNSSHSTVEQSPSPTIKGIFFLFQVINLQMKKVFHLQGKILQSLITSTILNTLRSEQNKYPFWSRNDEKYVTLGRSPYAPLV